MNTQILCIRLFAMLAVLFSWVPRAIAEIPASIDSDIYGYTITPAFRTYFAISGRLRLKLRPGSMTKYLGTFLDSQGHSTYLASADTTDPAAPVVVFSGFNGTFKFKSDSTFGSSFYSGIGVSAPIFITRHPESVFLGASSHSTGAASYSFSMSQRVGRASGANVEITGIITITYDANNRVNGGTVSGSNIAGQNFTNNIINTGYFNAGNYAYFQATMNGVSYNIDARASGTSMSGYASAGSGLAARVYVLEMTAVP